MLKRNGKIEIQVLRNEKGKRILSAEKDDGFSLVILIAGQAKVFELKTWVTLLPGTVYFIQNNSGFELTSQDALLAYRISFPRSVFDEIKESAGHIQGLRFMIDLTMPSRVRVLIKNGYLLNQTMIDSLLPLLQKMQAESQLTSKEAGILLRHHLLELFIEIGLFFTKIGHKSRLRAHELEAVLKYIDANFHKDIQLDDLVAKTGLSKFGFIKAFENTYKTTPMNYVRQVRIFKASKLLEVEGKEITDIAYEVGFPDSNNFSRMFKQHMGLSPRDYRSKHFQKGKASDTINLYLNFFWGMFEGPFFPQLLDGIIKAVASSPYRLNISGLRSFISLKDWQETMRTADCAGILLFAGLGMFESGKQMWESKIPAVNVNDDLHSVGIASVFCDDYKIGWEAASHFLDRRLENFAILASSGSSVSEVERIKGFVDRLRNDGISMPKSHIFQSGHLPEGIAKNSEILVEKVKKPAGLFCLTDRIAHGFYAFLRNTHYQIPKDFSVIGVDDWESSARLDPALTTFKVDVTGMGKAAVEMLFKKMAGEKTPMVQRILGELVVRSSVRK